MWIENHLVFLGNTKSALFHIFDFGFKATSWKQTCFVCLFFFFFSQFFLFGFPDKGEYPGIKI